jgi:alkanesulfonate monooxygenase SsuD/methylene tetrahydromethanopterin reductase-like flavin-dependent oxidoreductase (luciferase family)
MPGLRFAIDIAPLGDLADPGSIVRLAVAAESSGWDGISMWDSLGVSMGTAAADPFVTLAAVASRTERLALITSVIALPRRRPQLVAQSIGTLDRWSAGRCILGVGAGGDPGDFESFSEPYDAPTRVSRLDEGLAVIDALLRGETVHHAGSAYVVRGAAIGPSPVQRPRPPIWLGGMRPGALRRAARWDGWIAIGTSEDGASMELTPDAFGEMVERVHRARDDAGLAGRPFDIAVFGFTDSTEPSDFGARGATWWLESLSPMRGTLDDLLAIVEAGPPA